MQLWVCTTSDIGYVPKQAFVKTQYKLAGVAFNTRLRAIKDVGTLTK
jgi:hypothetical protein